MTAPLQEKTFSVARYGKKRLAALRTRYEAAGWKVDVDEQAKTMTAKWHGKPRRHARQR